MNHATMCIYISGTNETIMIIERMQFYVYSFLLNIEINCTVYAVFSFLDS